MLLRDQFCQALAFISWVRYRQLVKETNTSKLRVIKEMKAGKIGRSTKILCNPFMIPLHSSLARRPIWPLFYPGFCQKLNHMTDYAITGRLFCAYKDCEYIVSYSLLISDCKPSIIFNTHPPQKIRKIIRVHKDQDCEQIWLWFCFAQFCFLIETGGLLLFIHKN